MKLIKNIVFLILLLVIISGCRGGGKTLAGDVLKESPGTGSLEIVTVPAGADIFIDGNYMGKSDINLTNIAAGVRDFGAKKEFYADQVVKVTVLSGQNMFVYSTLSPVIQSKLG